MDYSVYVCSDCHNQEKPYHLVKDYGREHDNVKKIFVVQLIKYLFCSGIFFTLTIKIFFPSLTEEQIPASIEAVPEPVIIAVV